MLARISLGERVSKDKIFKLLQGQHLLNDKGVLVGSWIESLGFVHELVVLQVSGEDIIYDSKSIFVGLSERESQILTELLNNVERTISRDAIAKCLWGDGWHDKYSDWGIDKAISRLREKLSKQGMGSIIKTIRGKGFGLDSNVQVEVLESSIKSKG